ncbi:DNA gyrase/topoisomerase IV subunit A [Microbacterium sp. AK009]|uniref:hypothetical protein n=1 Tax=Microbacterium sp. AK009 TaxID=2723068 RepID=UPI0015CB283B|nr:hypothetical protein [Microbacterium sp. AK009]NYF16511.1 DNA gyrase/topoisomerase IV subunit A [Microbacterium sp. AK009]
MDERSNLLARHEIVRAYMYALENLPKVLAVCASSRDETDAVQRLRELFNISEIAADGILRLQVIRFIPEQIERVRSELNDIEMRLAQSDR